jgi:HlyD family secretion protein
MKKITIIMLILSLMTILLSCDNEKIDPGFTQDRSSDRTFTPSQTAVVEEKKISQTYEAVGTIRPLTESAIEAQISAQVLKINCAPGDAVEEGQVLVVLDSRQLNARLRQANEGLSVAQKSFNQMKKATDEARAGLEQAKSAYERSKKLYDSDIVSSQMLEIDKSAFLQAQARLEKTLEGEESAKASIRKAGEIVNEAKISLGYAQVKSPATGVVVKRSIDPGDQALPGKPLLVIQTSGLLRLEANVREGLINKIKLNHTYEVTIQTLEKTIPSKIEEIIPYADPVTRTFQVKASLPKTPGVFPGMFGRLHIPVEDQDTLLIPKDAVLLIGQLELTYVKRDNAWERVYIKTGKTFDDHIEVLSGLTADETIGF